MTTAKGLQLTRPAAITDKQEENVAPLAQQPCGFEHGLKVVHLAPVPGKHDDEGVAKVVIHAEPIFLVAQRPNQRPICPVVDYIDLRLCLRPELIDDATTHALA